MRKIGEEMKNTRQYSNKSLFWRDFFTGIKRFWMLLVLIVMLFVNLTFCIGGYFYSPVYIMERHLKVFADDQTEIETLNKQLINSFSDTFCYSQLKQDIIERMSPKYNSFSAEVLLPEDDNGVLSVRISSDNAYNSQIIMALFCDVYSEYARYITGNSSIAFENAGQEKILFEGFDWKKTILIGSGTGIIFCFILLVYYSISRRTIRSIAGMRSLASLDCLGSIPSIDVERLKKHKKETAILLTNYELSDKLKVSVENIAKNLSESCEDFSYKSVLITSTTYNEGKTAVAENVALALAAMGRKVVLLQANFRFNTKYNLKSDNLGLAEYLSGECEKNSIIKENSENMKLISPGCFLDRNQKITYDDIRMRDLMEYLKIIADVVIIDGPSVVSESETSDLLSYADSVIYVVRREYAWKQNILEGINIVKRYKKDILGFVMNGMNMKVREEK